MDLQRRSRVSNRRGTRSSGKYSPLDLLKKILLLASVSGLLSLNAFAGQATGTLAVNATVVNACSLSAGGAVAFGAYDPAANADATATGTFTMQCTNGTNTTILLGQGANAATSSPTRQMANGSNTLNYQLYTTSGGSTVWDSVAGVPQAANGTAQAIIVYGKIPRGQAVAAGTYADTVIITLSY